MGTHEQEVPHRDPIYRLDSQINLPGTIQQHGENDATQVEHVPGDKNLCDYNSKHPDLLPENLTREQREEIGIETEEEGKEICVRHVLQIALQAIRIEKLRDATENDMDLGPIMKEKREGTNSKEASKRPCGII